MTAVAWPSEIKTGNSHRRDLGDLTDLRKSIEEVALLHPIVINSNCELIAGSRRLAAFRQAFPDQQIPVTVVERMDDAVLALKAERDENVCRKAMLPSEMVALGRTLEALERPKAEARKREGQERGRATRAGLVERTGTPNQSSSGKTSEVVADAFGISARNYERARHLVAEAEQGDARAAEAVAEMDAASAEKGAPTITPAYNRYKGRTSAPSGKPPAPHAPGTRVYRKSDQATSIPRGLSALSGLALGFSGVTEIDASITREEAVVWRDDLQRHLTVLRDFLSLLEGHCNGTA